MLAPQDGFEQTLPVTIIGELQAQLDLRIAAPGGQAGSAPEFVVPPEVGAVGLAGFVGVVGFELLTSWHMVLVPPTCTAVVFAGHWQPRPATMVPPWHVHATLQRLFGPPLIGGSQLQPVINSPS